MFSRSLCKAISPRGTFCNSRYQPGKTRQLFFGFFCRVENENCFLIPYYQHSEWIPALKTCSRPAGEVAAVVVVGGYDGEIASITNWPPDARAKMRPRARVNHSTMRVRLSADKRFAFYYGAKIVTPLPA